MDEIKHISWDLGVLESVCTALGVPYDIKTTKTFCDKRVPYRKIDNDSPTCQACITEQQAEEQAVKNALQLFPNLMEKKGLSNYVES